MSRHTVLAALILLGSGSFGQGIPTLSARALSKPPTIDGEFQPGEWAGASETTAVFFDDETGQPLGDPVTFYLATSGDSIVFGVKVIDDPKTLQDSEYRPNVGLDSNDHIQLSVEPFARGSGFNQFRVNPAGAYQLSIAGGRAPKTEWLGAIKSAAKVTENGWQAEMSIPWAIMDLPGPGARDVMVNVRWNERSTLRGRMWHFNNGDGSKTPLWKGVEIPRVNTRPVLQLLPFTYLGGREGSKEILSNSGVDFKTALGSKAQAVGSINPDFRNIENQILSLDFSYFERLAGESRPFFQEGSGYRGPVESLFASQRIRSFDAGINTYGNINDKSTYSLLTTSDFGKQTAVVSTISNRINSLTDLSLGYVGNFQDGRDSSAGTVGFGSRSGIWNYFGSASFTDDQLAGKGDAYSLGVSMGAAGHFAFLGFDQVSPDFFPRLGFMPERDFKSLSFYSGWEKPHPRGPIMETEIEGGGSYSETISGEVYRRSFNLNGSITWRNLVDLDFGTSQTAFRGEVDQMHYANIEHPRGDGYRRWYVGASEGVLAGKSIKEFDFGIRYRPWKRVQTTLSSQWVDHFEKARQMIFSFNWERGLYESIGGRLVERDGKINWHLTWRRSGGLGNEFFVIIGDPNAPTFRKQLTIKAVFPLTVRF